MLRDAGCGESERQGVWLQWREECPREIGQTASVSQKERIANRGSPQGGGRGKTRVKSEDLTLWRTKEKVRCGRMMVVVVVAAAL